MPSWDLSTLWVTNNAEGRTDGSMTPIDPSTGKPGAADPGRRSLQRVLDADGKYAHHRRRSPQAPGLPRRTDDAAGILDRHARNAAASITPTSRSTARYAVFTCEFDGAITKIDLVNRKVVDTILPSPYYGRPDVVAMMAAFGKKPVTVLDSQELGGVICTAKGMPQDVRISPDGRPSSSPT